MQTQFGDALVVAASAGVTAVNRKTGEVATSEAGEALKELTVAVFSGDRVEVIRIRAPYIDDAIVARTPVRIEGLDMGLRIGDRGAWISWTADRITPAQTARPGRAGEPA